MGEKLLKYIKCTLLKLLLLGEQLRKLYTVKACNWLFIFLPLSQREVLSLFHLVAAVTVSPLIMYFLLGVGGGVMSGLSTAVGGVLVN